MQFHTRYQCRRTECWVHQEIPHQTALRTRCPALSGLQQQWQNEDISITQQYLSKSNCCRCKKEKAQNFAINFNFPSKYTHKALNSHYPHYQSKSWETLLQQNFTAKMPAMPMEARTSGLRRRCYSYSRCVIFTVTRVAVPANHLSMKPTKTM